MTNKKNEFIKILTKLVSFKTTENEYSEIDNCFEYIKFELSFYPFHIREFESNGKKSVYFGINKTVESDFLFTAHIDVVPAKNELFNLKESDGKLYGRGVFDMKYAVAMFIVTLKSIYEKNGKLPSVSLLFTSEEEVEGNNGPGFVLEKYKLKAKLAVLPDGGKNWHIVTKSKGLLQLKVMCEGTPAHGAYPWLGENAINRIFGFARDIQKIFPIPNKEKWVTTVNIGKISGGDSINKVCDFVEIFLDIRFTEKTSKEMILKKIDGLVKKHQNCSYEIIDHLPAFFVDKKNNYLKQWAKLISKEQPNNAFVYEHGASDATFFTAFNIPVLMSQPVGGKIHTNDEWLDLDSAIAYTEYLEILVS